MADYIGRGSEGKMEPRNAEEGPIELGSKEGVPSPKERRGQRISTKPELKGDSWWVPDGWDGGRSKN